jgi:DNA ligase-associated metallophosphoesterase
MLTIPLEGQSLILLPEKAALLPDAHTLLVADAHIGKAVSFRRLGVPVPQGTTTDTLGVLSRLVARHAVRHIVFLGDFLHSRRAHAPSTQNAVARWRADHASLRLTLVRGNHDDHAGDPPAALGFEVVDEPLPMAGLLMCHHPVPREGGYVLAGHTHPCVGLSGRAFDRLRLPCFHFGPRVGVLPAFGGFTGMHPIARCPGDRVFAIADGHVARVPGLPDASHARLRAG